VSQPFVRARCWGAILAAASSLMFLSAPMAAHADVPVCGEDCAGDVGQAPALDPAAYIPDNDPAWGLTSGDYPNTQWWDSYWTYTDGLQTDLYDIAVGATNETQRTALYLKLNREWRQMGGSCRRVHSDDLYQVLCSYWPGTPYN
jgi:hypothetical protein